MIKRVTDSKLKLCSTKALSRLPFIVAGALSGSLNAMGQVLWENRSFVFLVLCAVIARLIMAPYHQTGDLFQSAVVYAEDFFHKAGWNYAEL